MASKTSIEWTRGKDGSAGATWNPITGCSIVSPGCTHCYAMKLAGGRLKHHPSRKGLTKMTKAGPVWNGTVRFNESWLTQPLEWKQPRMIFVCAHGDLFHEDVPDEWIDKVLAVMALSPQHTFQVLTKRSDRMRRYFAPIGCVNCGDGQLDGRCCDEPYVLRGDAASEGFRDALIEGQAQALYAKLHPEETAESISMTLAVHAPLPNVWLGVSAERQQEADARIPDLLATPAAVRFVSLEPLLGPIDLSAVPITVAPGFFGGALNWHHRGKYHEDEGIHYPTLDWIIVGGESGNGARPMHPDWVRSLRDQCAAAGKLDRFFFKQFGAWAPGENVERQKGTVATAHWFGNNWSFSTENLANHEGHVDDQPDLYRIGKKAAGRHLDGVEHNGMPV